jgi:uncharacterized protein YciI
MKYFVVFLKANDIEAANKYHEAHVEYVNKLCEEKKIHLVGKLVDAGGLIVFQADNKEKVESWLAQDPFIVHGARTYELYEWHMHTAEQYLAK